MSQKKKTTAQSKRPRKAPSNQTGGTAWGKKAAAAISGKMQSADVKKLILLNFPYIIAFYMVEKAAWLYRYCNGDTIVDRLMVLFMNFGLAYKSYLPSFHPFDLLVGLIGAAALKAVIYFKGKNAKKYRQGEEYGSARWGNAKDMEPFIDPVFENNVLLTQTERLMMSGRPKHPKYARNKNVIVIGGSGSGKTRFFVKPNLMQMPEKVSYVCTDPKGTIIIECGKMLSDAGYKIKVLNTINFKKSMHYNPFHYIRSEKDILKLVNTIIANTKGDGEKSGEDFWVKAERLLYCALIGYIYYEAPEEEQNFSTLLEFINASEAREDDEEFKNPVDELFEDLEKAKPEHFAVRQYKKYKLAAGKTAKSILISCGARLAPFDIAELRDLMAYDEMELDLLGDRRTALFVIISDTDDRRLHEGHDTTFNKWHSSSVLRILDSQVYIGNLVTGKTRTASYKGIGLHPVDKGEWNIVENAHEAIILKSDFEIVQEKRNRNKEKRNNAMARSEQVRAECRNHFAGMVFCGCCRRSMTFVRQVHKTEEESYFGVFQCKRKKGTTPCSYHTVPEKMLMMVAMKQIHHLVSTMCEEEKMVKEMLNNGGLDSTRSIKVKENSIAFRIQETEERRLRLYEDYKAEILDEEEYSRLKEHYIAEKQRLEHELQKQRQRSLELEKRMRICDEQMERMRAILNQKEFDEELVHELIKKIYVGIDNSVEIEFKCSDPYQEVLAFVAEVQNE